MYYNCVKFHKNPISRLGEVTLTRYMPSFFSWKYKLNYLPFQILDSDYISSCTSASSVLQLCKVSQKSNKPFRRSCAYKIHGRTEWFLYIHPNFVCGGYNNGWNNMVQVLSMIVIDLYPPSGHYPWKPSDFKHTNIIKQDNIWLIGFIYSKWQSYYTNLCLTRIIIITL